MSTGLIEFRDMDTMEQIHKGILLKFHKLCGLLGLEEYEKRAIIESFGVESSVDIDTHDLIDLCADLSKRLGGDAKDKQRKRAIAAIGGYLTRIGKENNIDAIKAIACRATGYPTFNKIPPQRLQNLYNTFRNKQKDIEGVDRVVAEAMAQIYNRPLDGDAIC